MLNRSKPGRHAHATPATRLGACAAWLRLCRPFLGDEKKEANAVASLDYLKSDLGKAAYPDDLTCVNVAPMPSAAPMDVDGPDASAGNTGAGARDGDAAAGNAASGDGDAAPEKNLIATKTERGVLLTIRDWKTDTYVNTKLIFDVVLRVFDSSGKERAKTGARGENNLGGSNFNPPAHARKAVPPAFREKLKTLFNNPKIVATLK